MKFALVFAAVLLAASAQFPPQVYRPLPSPISPSVSPYVVRPATNDQTANIVRYENDIFPDGSYNYAFETDNGISAQARGTPKSFGGNPPVVPVVSQGSFSWTSPEGQPIGITFTADENGYQAQGDSIPTPPPIPPLILKALDFLARNPQAPQK